MMMMTIDRKNQPIPAGTPPRGMSLRREDPLNNNDYQLQ